MRLAGEKRRIADGRQIRIGVQPDLNLSISNERHYFTRINTATTSNMTTVRMSKVIVVFSRRTSLRIKSPICGRREE